MMAAYGLDRPACCSTLKMIRSNGIDHRAGLPTKWISAIAEDNESLVVSIDAIGIRRFVGGHLKPYLLGNGQQYSSIEFVACFIKNKRFVLDWHIERSCENTKWDCDDL